MVPPCIRLLGNQNIDKTEKKKKREKSQTFFLNQLDFDHIIVSSFFSSQMHPNSGDHCQYRTDSDAVLSCSGGEYSVFPHPDDCPVEFFYACIAGHGWRVKCFPGCYYDMANGQCDCDKNRDDIPCIYKPCPTCDIRSGATRMYRRARFSSLRRIRRRRS